MFLHLQESTKLLAYKTKNLDLINSNHVNHKVVRANRNTEKVPEIHITPAPPLFAEQEDSASDEEIIRVTPPTQTKEELKHDCARCGCEVVRINVSGMYFECRVAVLDRHPDTLLGNPAKRNRYYDRHRNEYFLDRHRPSFEAIFCYLQNGTRLRRPHNVPEDVFLTELYFYELEEDVLEEYRRGEGYVSEKIVLPTNKTMRKIWVLFEFPETSRPAFGIAVLSVIMTVISIILFCVETLPVFAMTHCIVDEAPNFLDPFFVVETMCTAWFTFEIIIRYIVCPHKFRFWKDFNNLVDFTAIIPYYVTFINVVSTMSCASAKSSASLGFLRVIRLVRVFKLTKHSTGLQVS